MLPAGSLAERYDCTSAIDASWSDMLSRVKKIGFLIIPCLRAFCNWSSLNSFNRSRLVIVRLFNTSRSKPSLLPLSNSAWHTFPWNFVKKSLHKALQMEVFPIPPIPCNPKTLTPWMLSFLMVLIVF
ncbi:hypothetical protein M758_9G131400 [Ceratodon purpureus]|nr:hypothetical protein M758_9G131400 [Ceratodon purpureus]